MVARACDKRCPDGRNAIGGRVVEELLDAEMRPGHVRHLAVHGPLHDARVMDLYLQLADGLDVSYG